MKYMILTAVLAFLIGCGENTVSGPSSTPSQVCESEYNYVYIRTIKTLLIDSTANVFDTHKECTDSIEKDWGTSNVMVTCESTVVSVEVCN